MDALMKKCAMPFAEKSRRPGNYSVQASRILQTLRFILASLPSRICALQLYLIHLFMHFREFLFRFGFVSSDGLNTEVITNCSYHQKTRKVLPDFPWLKFSVPNGCSMEHRLKDLLN